MHDINEHIKTGDGERSNRVNKFSIAEIPTVNPLNSTPLHESEQCSSSPACSLPPSYTAPQRFFTGIKIPALIHTVLHEINGVQRRRIPQIKEILSQKSN